jgi:hypothetical protein
MVWYEDDYNCYKTTAYVEVRCDRCPARVRPGKPFYTSLDRSEDWCVECLDEEIDRDYDAGRIEVRIPLEVR